MDIKCNFHPYYNLDKNRQVSEVVFGGRPKVAVRALKGRSRGLSGLNNKSLNLVKKEIFVKRRPVNAMCAAGLLSIEPTAKVVSMAPAQILVEPKTFSERIKNYAKNYVENIKHTYDHKIVFAMIEKELTGFNSIDSITHDLDKLILYALGFPKSFVTEFHRKHSEHHYESGKKMNLRSMLCDNIASSPEFKPEKRWSLREYFNKCSELQSIKGFKDILEKHNYGESLNFNKINAERKGKYTGIAGFMLGVCRLKLPNLF